MASLDSMALPVPEQSGDIVWAQLPTAANAPSARSGHSFTIVPASRQVRRISAAESDALLCGRSCVIGNPDKYGLWTLRKEFKFRGYSVLLSWRRCWATLFALGGVRFKHPGGERRLFACDTGLYVWGLRRESKPRYFLQRFARPQNLRGLRLGHGACAPADCMPRPLRPRPIPCDLLELAR